VIKLKKTVYAIFYYKQATHNHVHEGINCLDARRNMTTVHEDSDQVMLTFIR